jgi:hypothetical protein
MGGGVYGSGVDGGRIMPWQCGIMCLELVKKKGIFLSGFVLL